MPLTEPQMVANDRRSARDVFAFWGIGVLVVGGTYVAGLLAYLWLLAFATVLFALFLGGLARPLRTKLGFRHSLAILGVAALLTGAAATLALLLGPRIIDQVTELQRRLPRAIDTLRSWVGDHPWLADALRGDASARSWMGTFDVSRRVTQFLSTLAGIVTAVLVIGFGGLYLSLNPAPYLHGAVRLVPPAHRPRARHLLAIVARGLRRWLVGRFASMLIVAILTSLGLWLLGLPLALTLGLIAGLLSFVPYIGPIAAAIPAVLVALLQGVQMVLWVALVYTVVQFVESYLVTPGIQRQAVSLPPAVLLLAQIAAALLFGPIGVILATPLTVAAILFVQVLYVREALGDPVPLLTEERD